MAGLNSTQTFAFTALIALLLTSGLAQGRDWRWYPRKSPGDSGALRPDLEGTRDDDAEQREMSELEEMRQWLRRRDEDRRRLGITVPDTVEQLEPPGESAAPRRERPERSTRRLTGEFNPEPITDEERLLDEESERVRETLFPHFDGRKASHSSRQAWRHYSYPSWRSIFRHGKSAKSRKGSSSRRRH